MGLFSRASKSLKSDLEIAADHLAAARRSVLAARQAVGSDERIVIALHGVLKAMDAVEALMPRRLRDTSRRT